MLAARPKYPLERTVEKIPPHALLLPERKLRIGKALQAWGHIVPMAGNDVNDAHTLNAGDVGTAVGLTRTDLAKDAAETVLLEDYFAEISILVVICVTKNLLDRRRPEELSISRGAATNQASEGYP